MKHSRLGYAGWRWVQHRARAMLRNPGSVRTLLRDANLKPKEQLGEARGQLGQLMRLLRAWINGDYRGVSTTTLVAVVGAVLYFVLPLDLVPDLILGIGLVDDVAVIAWVVNRFRDELDRFASWEAARDSPDDGDPEV